MARIVIPTIPGAPTETPDLDGFHAAMRFIREEMGSTVTFVIPASLDQSDYAAGTSFDPETGLPFDPLADPTAPTGPTLVEIVATVVHRPIDRRVNDAAVNTAVGMLNSANIALLISVEDRSKIEGATEVLIWNERFQITEIRPDGFEDVDRFIVYTESK